MTDQASTGTSARRTRRHLLAGGTGALAAVLTAEALARPAPAAAANGDNMIVGQSNSETSATVIANSTDGDMALVCDAAGPGVGVVGNSDIGDGVLGTATLGNGVQGITKSRLGSGVVGHNTGDGNAVAGHASNAAASGVYGQNDGTGYGVAGRANAGVGTLGDSARGVGVWANSPNGTALPQRHPHHRRREDIGHPDRRGADPGEPGTGHRAAGPAGGLGPLCRAGRRQALVHRAPEQAGAGPHQGGVVRDQLSRGTANGCV